MPAPTFAQLRSLSSPGSSLAPESLAERQLTALSILASQQNPDGSPLALPSRLFPVTNGPSAATANAGPFINGVGFFPNQGGQWLNGYYLWCCSTGGQLTAAGTKAALWIQTGAGTATLVPGSVATLASTLTPGTWNYIPLGTPIQLTIGVAYIAAIGINGPTPLTANQFGAAQPFVNGIVSGSVSAFSDATSGGTFNNPWTTGNGLFTTTGTDPAVTCPFQVSNSSNFWVDVSLSSSGPFTSYRLWPVGTGALIYDPGTSNDIAANYALSTEIDLARSCTAQYIWFYSPATVTQLPTVTDIWSINSGGLTGVNVYTNPAPGWSGAAGSGWVRSAVSSLTLPAGKYRVAVYNGAGSPAVFSAKRLNYWGHDFQFLSANQISIESGTTGWVANSNCSISSSTLQAFDGTHSLALSSTGAGDMTASTPQGTGAFPVTSGVLYTVSTWVRAATAPRSVLLGVVWYDAGGGFISTSVAASGADSTTAWTQLSGSLVPVTGAAFAALLPYVSATAGVAEVHYFDLFSFTFSGGGTVQSLSPGLNGITVGPMTAPSYSTGAQLCYSYGTGNAFTEPGQNPFAVGPPDQYPNQYVGVHSTGGNLFQNYWVDLEVT